jgi:hypothetical protein
MRAIFYGSTYPHTPASSAEFSIAVIGDELAGFVEAGAELEDLPSFEARLEQYRKAVERAMLENFIENAMRWRS